MNVQERFFLINWYIGLNWNYADTTELKLLLTLKSLRLTKNCVYLRSFFILVYRLIKFDTSFFVSFSAVLRMRCHHVQISSRDEHRHKMISILACQYASFTFLMVIRFCWISSPKKSKLLMVSNIEKTNLKDMIDKVDVLKVQRI